MFVCEWLDKWWEYVVLGGGLGYFCSSLVCVGWWVFYLVRCCYFWSFCEGVKKKWGKVISVGLVVCCYVLYFFMIVVIFVMKVVL